MQRKHKTRFSAKKFQKCRKCLNSRNLHDFYEKIQIVFDKAANNCQIAAMQTKLAFTENAEKRYIAQSTITGLYFVTGEHFTGALEQASILDCVQLAYVRATYSANIRAIEIAPSPRVMAPRLLNDYARLSAENAMHALAKVESIEAWL